ncbi:MAG: 5-(carboxyamino)imidazole ribonucleotide mutase [Oscillospiraceae bacterium]|nr:5-(carboxyamino)imidazole ribonucleotide mutase [Oscillospiraceae bacterium]
MKKVMIVMGSAGDEAVAAKAAEVLSAYGIPYEVHVASAHRTPDRAALLASGAREAGFGAIICFAGMAAHLAGAFAARTVLPVIGVPVKGGVLDGSDALLATVQMPSGIPVATVAVNGGANAAHLAAQILGVYDGEVYEKLLEVRQKAADKVLADSERLEEKYRG